MIDAMGVDVTAPGEFIGSATGSTEGLVGGVTAIGSVGELLRGGVDAEGTEA